MTNKLKGKDFLLFAERDEAMVPFCCARELSISVIADTIEATKAPQSIWRSFIYGNLSYTVSASGLITLEGFTIEDLYDAQFSRLPLNFIARHDLGEEFFLSGSIILTNIDVIGSNKDVMQMSISGTGDGVLNRTKTLQTFPLLDGEGNIITDGEGNTMTVAPDQYGTDVPIDISIDC